MSSQSIVLGLLLCSGVICGGCGSSDHEKSETDGYEINHRVYTDGSGQRAIEIRYRTKVDVYRNGAVVESSRPKVEAEMLGIFESSRPIVQRQPLDVVYLQAEYVIEQHFLFTRTRRFLMEFKKDGDAWIRNKQKS
jgi:hypothetical protein